VLREISSDVEGFIREQPGAINVENQFVKTNTELLFRINKEKANMLGVPVIEIDRTIRTAIDRDRAFPNSGTKTGKSMRSS
jgi:multidrug efflux pump subunit AcrB